ncbi:MAG: FMN-binding negative transcriptional regulator, partial [Steroidobacteraceae bacterium]
VYVPQAFDEGRVDVLHACIRAHPLVTRLTNEHEGNRAEPWKVSDAPEDFVVKQLRAIVGIEVPLARLVGKWKASQNRSQVEIESVRSGLATDGNAFAAVMREP